MTLPENNTTKLKMPSPALAQTTLDHIREFFPDCITDAVVRMAL
ncbi:MAG: hypothetical protein ABF672_08680 [Gluconobacter oxydans]